MLRHLGLFCTSETHEESKTLSLDCLGLIAVLPHACRKGWRSKTVLCCYMHFRVAFYTEYVPLL